MTSFLRSDYFQTPDTGVGKKKKPFNVTEWPHQVLSKDNISTLLLSYPIFAVAAVAKVVQFMC